MQGSMGQRFSRYRRTYLRAWQPNQTYRLVNRAKEHSVRDLALLVRFLIGRIGELGSAFHADELAGFDSLCRENVINYAAVCAGCGFFSLHLLQSGQRGFHKAQGKFPG